MRSSRLSTLLGAALTVGVVASCDDPTRPTTEASLEPRIQLIQADSATRASLVLPLTEVRVRTFGPTGRVVPLTLSGGAWRGTVTGLSAGDYEVVIEGIAAGQVQYYGRLPNITIARGQRAQPTVTFAAAVPVVANPPLNNTTNFSQRIPYAAIPAATGYVVQASKNSDFNSGVIELATVELNPLVTVNETGIWFVRSRAVLPQVSAASTPWSDTRTWTVVEANGGGNAGEAQSVPLVPEDPETVVDRNLTATKRVDWYDIALQQGDSLFAETFADRLPFRSLLNTTLTLFQTNGVDSVAGNLDAVGTVDSRLVYVAAATQTYKLRVGATGSTVGHYELVSEIRRLPLAPSALVPTIVSGTEVTLNWTDNSNNETSFRIERCEGETCTDFAEVGNTAPNVTTLAQTGLTQGATYRWRVRARNNVGNSEYTAVATAALVGPAAPTNLAATTLSNTSIQLTWTDVATNETGYEIQRCTVGGGCTFATINTTGPNLETFVDATAAYNTSYQYQIRALNNVLPSPFTPPVSANTIPPATPTGLTAAVAGPTTINLSWTDASANETYFLIERCLGAACTGFVQIDSVGADVTNYASTVANNADYRFRIRARNAVISQTYTAIAEANTRPPATPTGLTATTQGPTSIALAWTDVATTETGYLVERCSSGPACTDFTTVTTTAANAVAYTDNSATVGNSYRYRVTAVGVAGNSAASNIATANTLLPAAPTSLAASTISANVVRLTWTDAADNETGYSLLRCATVGCTPTTQIRAFASGVTTIDDSTTVVGLRYTYALRATNIAGASASSNQATASTEAPAAPSGLVATVLSATQVNLTWVNNAPEAIGTRVERCTGVGCSDFTEIEFVAAPGANYVDAGVSVGNVYSYRLRAQNAADVSPFTSTATVTTALPASPGNLTARAESPTAVLLTWSASSGPNLAGYLIARCSTPGCTDFAPVDSVGPANLQYIESGLATDSDYRYTVRALNVVGQSPALPVDISLRVPAVPNVAATVGVGFVDVALTNLSSVTTDSVEIERSCVGGGCSFVQLAVLDFSGDSTYRDAAVVANEVYLYRARAYNNVGASAYSAEAAGSTALSVAPDGLTAMTQSATSIQLTWNDLANSETGYAIERCAGDACASFAIIDTVADNSTSFLDTGLATETSYTYRVSALAPFGASAPSGEATATTRIPAAPTGLVATTQSNTAIRLTWNDNANNETQFAVERCAGVGCTDFAQVGTTATDVLEFEDAGLTSSTVYRYRVIAVNAAGASAASNIAEATTNLPAIPTALSATVVGAAEVQLAWTENATDELDIRVERCTGAACADFGEISTLPPNANQLSDATVAAGETYRYRVRARNGAGFSDFSNEVTVSLLVPDAPVGLSATTVSATRIDIAWTDVSNNETTFRLERCTGPGCADFVEIAVIPRDAASYSDETVSIDNEYSYRLRAVNAIGSSAEAGPIGANTFAPNAPTSLAATTASISQINLAWTDNGPYETGFEIERCVGPACVNFTLLTTTAANVTSFQNTGLAANQTYRYRVRAINAVAASAYSNIDESATDVPADPDSLAAVAASATRIDLTWVDAATNETDYIVERCTGVLCGVFSSIALLGPNVESYADETVDPGQTYSYRVRAVNANGSSNFSNVATTNTSAPNAPTALTATTVNATRINLAWTDNADNELSVEVERCAGAGCAVFAPLVTLPAGRVTHVDSTITPDEVFTYRVRAVNNVATSAYSNDASADNLRPAAPSLFEAVTISATRIDLSWQENANNESGYRIERCVGDGCTDFALLQDVPANTNSYSDVTALAGQTYRYQIFGFNISGLSNAIAPVQAETTVPATPTGLTLVAVNATQVDLSWTDVATNEDGYRIEQCVGVGCEFLEVGAVGAGVTTFSATGLSASTIYSFRIRAFNAAGTSAYTPVAVANTFGPTAPSALSTTTVFSNRIDLAWTDNATNEFGFRIERCLGGSCADFTEIGTAPANSTTYADETLVFGQTYRYRIRAFNGVANSGYSAIANGNTNVPLAPTLLNAVPVSQAQINLTWTDNASGETGYRVERCAGPGCTDFTELVLLAANANAYADNSVVAETAYRYRVRALGNGASDFSNEAEATTILPLAPSDVQAVAVSDTRVDLTWTDNATNETAYEVERCQGAGCSDFVVVAFLLPNTTTFSNTGLFPGLTYAYRVRATNGAGASAYVGAAAEVSTNVPALPSALLAVVAGAGQIDLSWTDNASTEDGVRIERCEGPLCSDFAQIAEVAVVDVTTYSDASAVDGVTYRYRVRAYNANGASGPTDAVSITGGTPLAPTAFSAVTASATQIDLTWTDESDNETGFEVLRCAGIGCGPVTLLTTVGAGVTSYADASVVLGESYTYAVRSVNAAGASAPTGEVTATTILPAAPTGLAAQSVSATQVDLTWTDNATNESVYRVERCISASCTFALVQELGADATSYSDAGLSEGETYRYRVYAVNAAGNSGFTAEVLATTDFPLPPTNLAAATVTGTRIDLTWTDNASNEDGYDIERCVGVGCSSFTPLVSLPADAVTYSDVSVVVGESYTYQVRATRPAANSAFSPTATANTFLPAVPTLTSATATSSTSVTLTWPSDPAATGVRIERCAVSSCTFTEIATVNEPTVTYLNTGLTAGVTYRYRIRRYNNAGPSDPSNELDVALVVPAVPVNVQTVAQSPTSARIGWNDVSPDETGFRVERCDGAGCVIYVTRGTVAANTTTFDDTGLTAGISYTYRVYAQNALGESAPSSGSTVVMVVPANPIISSAATLGAGTIRVQWADFSNNERGFAIERCAGVGCIDFVQIATVGINVTTFFNTTGVSLNETYRYRVRAFNNVGVSGYTAIVEANTIVPVAPAGLAAQTLSGTSIRLTWTDNATTETGYRVFRCALADCSDAVLLTQLGANAVQYDDGAVTFGNNYYYVVRAFNVAGPSTPSNIVLGSTVLNAPTTLRAGTYNRNSVRLTWADNSVYESGFEIEACEGIGCSDFTPVATAAANAVQYIVGGLNAGSDYTFRMRALSGDGNSGFTGGAGARTPVAIATDAVVTGIADTAFGERHYVLTVPPGTSQLRVLMEPAGSDPDLYVRLSLSPSFVGGSVSSDTLCIPYASGVETCTFTNPTPGDWYVMVQGYFSPYSGARLSVVLGPTNFTLTTCNNSGSQGPIPLACQFAYSGGPNAGRVTVVNGIQNFSLPHTGRYRITARGAQGASATAAFVGGRGAQVSGEFDFTAGQILQMAVGQMGTGQGSLHNGGGGGGTFVVDQANNPLLIAGGGGGTRVDALQNGCDASIAGFGVTGVTASTSTCTPKIVSLGLGGANFVSWGAAGAGFLGNGANDPSYGTGGLSWANGLVGGTGTPAVACTFIVGVNASAGGFGGGGSGNGCRGGGGGGGYSGGDGGWVAGGGGSFLSGLNQQAITGAGVGHGQITIQYIGPSTP